MFVHPQDLAGARWLTSAAGGDSVYADYFSKDMLLAYSNIPIENFHTLYMTSLGPKSVIYVCSSEATSQSWTDPQEASFLGWPAMQSPQFTDALSKVYDSGCAIYTTPA
jgi:hypothetical protein